MKTFKLNTFFLSLIIAFCYIGLINVSAAEQLVPYGQDQMPSQTIDGAYWYNAIWEVNEEYANKTRVYEDRCLPARSFFIPSKTKSDALIPLYDWREKENWQSLNGLWDFKLVSRPDEVIENFHKNDFQIGERWIKMPVPSSWQLEENGINDEPIYSNWYYPWTQKGYLKLEGKPNVFGEALNYSSVATASAPKNYNPVAHYIRYFTLDEATNLLQNQNALNQYRLPSVADWSVMTIDVDLRFPPKTEISGFPQISYTGASSPYRLAGSYIINDNNIDLSDLQNKPIGKYLASDSSPVGVAYVIRFGGTRLHSAWRYEFVATQYDSSKNALDGKLILKCRSIKNGSATTLETITQQGYFDHEDVVTKEIPIVGVAQHGSVGYDGEYWSEYPNRYIGYTAYYMTSVIYKSSSRRYNSVVEINFTYDDVDGTTIENSGGFPESPKTKTFRKKLPVRLSYKEYPLKKK